MFEKLYQALEDSALKTVNYLQAKLEKDGSYGADASDIACYFKAPMMFSAAGKLEQANLVLDHIKAAFMLANGDFKTTQDLKSVKPEYNEFYAYANGWIVRAAQQRGRTDISEPGYHYLTNFVVGNGKSFLTNSLEADNGVSDVLTAAHHGLINLERGNLELAKAAGNYLCGAMAKQPNKDKGFYLRFNALNEPLTEFNSEMGVFYLINKNEPNQLYFMIGYPSAYLALLYKATGDNRYLEGAKAYLDFALACHESVLQSNFSHKIAWAASIVYGITQEPKYAEAIEKIVTHFNQTKGNDALWYQSADANVSYDQSAEIACWFLDIANNLKPFVKQQEASQQPPEEGQEATKSSVKAMIAGAGLHKKPADTGASQARSVSETESTEDQANQPTV